MLDCVLPELPTNYIHVSTISISSDIVFVGFASGWFATGPARVLLRYGFIGFLDMLKWHRGEALLVCILSWICRGRTYEIMI